MYTVKCVLESYSDLFWQTLMTMPTCVNFFYILCKAHFCYMYSDWVQLLLAAFSYIRHCDHDNLANAVKNEAETDRNT